MNTTLRYGAGTSCQVDLDEITRVGPVAGESFTEQNVAEQVRAALNKPHHYPPLAAATVPGDQIAVAVQPGVPLLKEVLQGVSSALRDAGVDHSNSLFLFSTDPSGPDRTLDQWAIENQLNARLHHPDDANECSMIGVTQSGLPLRLNRRLGDADVVLPIGVASVGVNGAPDRSKFGGLFPEFSDAETISRFRTPDATRSGRKNKARQREIDESGWLLGVGMTLEIVPGPGGTVAAALAGDPTTVTHLASEKYREVWSQSVPDGGDLVIALVSGSGDEQSWQSLGRALAAARSVLEPGGAVAIFTELAEPPGPSVRRLAEDCDYAQLQRKLQGDRFVDSHIARLLCQALERGPVYLHSQLSDEIVESLGLAPIASESELAKLARTYRKPIVMEDAHRLLPVMA